MLANTRRRSRKPWMWFEDGLWHCRSNVGTVQKMQMITGASTCPRRAYAVWEWLKQLSDEGKKWI